MSNELMFDRVPPQNIEAEQAVLGDSAADRSVNYVDGTAAR